MQKRKLGSNGLEVSAIGFGRLDHLKENLASVDLELTP